MQTKTKQNDNPDVHYANCNMKNARKVLVKCFDKNHTTMLSCEDKYNVKIGASGFPLALFPKTKVGQVEEAVEVIAANHDTFTKSNFVPTVTFHIDMPKNPNLGSFYNVDVHIGVKDSAILPTSDVRQEMKIVWIMMEKINKSKFIYQHRRRMG